MTTSQSRFVARSAEAIRRAKKPAILVGTGARGATRAALQLARVCGAPILTTPEAKSQIDETGVEAAGVFSFGASDFANAVVAAADAVVALGSGLGEFASRGGNAFLGKTVIQVADDPRDVATSVTPEVVHVGDVDRSARALARALCAHAKQRWFLGLRAQATRPKPPRASTVHGIDPRAAVSAIGAALPQRSRIACDVTSATLTVLRDLRLGPQRRLWTSLEKSACMGSALPAGIGLRIGSGLPTLVLIGDWGLMMGQSELHTLASLGIGKLAIVVWSNSGGALIRCGVRAQSLAAPATSHTWDRPPSFELVARGYDLRAVTVRTATHLRRALTTAFASPFPVLIDAIIDPGGDVPAADRYLHLNASGSGQ